MEFLTAETRRLVDGILGIPGRMISGSKLAYSNAHPGHVVFFNANLYDSQGTKIWYGDVDVTLDRPKLEQIARDLKCCVYVTSESPFRWNEGTTLKETLREIQAACQGDHPSAVRIDP